MKNNDHGGANKNVSPPSPASFPHRMNAQLRFNDIDILGHLNNTVYFSLYDMGKARYMESAGLRPKGQSRPDTVIADIHCAYLKPILFDDSIDVLTRCSHIGEKSYTLEQMLVDKDDEVRSVCRTVMVYIDHESLRPAPIPEEYIKKIKNFEADHG